MNDIERARQRSAEMSTLLGTTRAEERTPVINDALVEEMCAHLLNEKLRDLKADHIAPEDREQYRKAMLPQVHFADAGFKRLAVTRDDFERLLRPWTRELGRLTLRHPRNDVHKTSADYLTYLRRTVGDEDGWYGRFERMQTYLAHIHRIDDEERAEREEHRRAEAQRQRDEEERRRKERAALERQAKVDEREVKRLLAVIAEAEDIEALLALHNKAQTARGALRAIYTREREACDALGKPVPERSVPEAAGTLGDGFALGLAAGSSSKQDPLILPTLAARPASIRRG